MLKFSLASLIQLLKFTFVSEFEEFKNYFKKSKVYRFVPSKEIKEKYKDGGVAIIDQWIAAHARYNSKAFNKKNLWLF